MVLIQPFPLRRHSAPVLDCCFHDAVHAYSGDCDNNLKMYDFNAGQEKTIGSHRAPIRCVEYCSDGNVIATGSCDILFTLNCLLGCISSR